MTTRWTWTSRATPTIEVRQECGLIFEKARDEKRQDKRRHRRSDDHHARTVGASDWLAFAALGGSKGDTCIPNALREAL